MKTGSKAKKSTEGYGAEETRRLMEAAMKQPGVAELLRVYQTWQKFDRVLDTQNQFTATKQIVSTSSSSFPVPCEAA